MKKSIAIQIAVTYEICGSTTLSQGAMDAVCEALDVYPEYAVSKALARCQKEVTGRLSLAYIIERIDDGRPSPNEAWALAPKSENESAVWTREIIHAWGQAQPLQDDKIAMRMTFMEVYKESMRVARDSREPVEWTFSAGHDPGHRVAVIEKALLLGRLTEGQADHLLPGRTSKPGVKQLPAAKPEYATPDEIKEMVAKLAAGMELEDTDG